MTLESGADRPEAAAVPPNAPRDDRRSHDGGDAGRRGVPAWSALSERAVAMERERLAAAEKASRADDTKLFTELGTGDNLAEMGRCYRGEAPLTTCTPQDEKIIGWWGWGCIGAAVLIAVAGVCA